MIKYRNIIIKALCKILQTKEFSNITVKDIVEKSNISRPTFYRYFKDKYDIVEQVFTEDLINYRKYYDNKLTWYQECICHMNSILKRKDLYKELMLDKWARDTLCRIIKDDICKDYTTNGLYLREALQNSAPLVLCEWCKYGCVLPPEEMFELIVISLPLGVFLDNIELGKIKERCKEITAIEKDRLVNKYLKPTITSTKSLHYPVDMTNYDLRMGKAVYR